MVADQFPPRWHEVVRQHFTDTAGYVIAQTGTCLGIQAQETGMAVGRVRGRDFRPLSPADLPGLKLPSSWFIGIILCPGDDPTAYIQWYGDLDPPDRERVVFFTHPEFHVDKFDTPWKEADLAPPRTQRFNGNWEKFHQLYGRRHGEQVYADHPPQPSR